ncbi:EmrB/QacA subfamily drug resistance transporter [Desulfitobacterium sp. LBE]|uniref:MFS transporter n=1 Tax=Desulfitobacterium sp. LBE TaxID=884086 RepID=UPI00119B1066|nr:MFS transporter [Desulfitobacterium sp. LBE]TWH55987.1 EmrB/QacA subfamily drug resistance transporter [Desulfitobacterium sp. LBE]
MTYDHQFVRSTMIICLLTSFIGAFMSNSVNIAIPALSLDFTVTQLHLNWVVTIYLLTSAALSIPCGRLADIIGRRKLFLIGIGLFCLSSLGCSLTPSFNVLIFFRLCQGVANAMIAGTSMAILTTVVPPQQRGKALGIASAAVYIGLSLGPVLGGLFVKLISWRAIFAFGFAVDALILVLILTKLTGEWKAAAGEVYDYKGAALWISGLTLLLFALSNLALAPFYTLLLIAGLVLLGIFIRVELKSDSPIFALRIFAKNTPFIFSNLATVINYLATFALGYLLALYLQLILGLDSSLAGLILLSQPVLMALLSPLAGRLSDKIQPRILSSVGMAIVTAGLLPIIFFTSSTPIALIVADLVFIGIGYGLFASPNTNAVMSSVDKRYYSIASSTLGTMRLLGQTLSMATVSLMTSHFIGNTSLYSPEYPQAFMVSFKLSFILFTLLCFLGIFASLARGKKEQVQ